MKLTLKSIFTKLFYCVYFLLIFAFAISILILISYMFIDETIDWYGALILYGILIPVLLIFKTISKKLKEKNMLQ